MHRICTLFSFAFLAFASVAAAVETPSTTTGNTTRQIAPAGVPSVLTSTSSSASLHARETAGPDTFDLYGGPDEPAEGKFQLADGVTPDWGDGLGVPADGKVDFGPGAWKPVDLTDQPVYWHVDTFNAENLHGNGAGNHAMWSGVAEGDPLAESWSRSSGYGNGWDDALLYVSEPLADPSIDQVVSLDFYFNHDTEPAFDFFGVQYDSAGTWSTVYFTDGSNADTLGVFNPPGVQFSTVQTAPITYAGNDYGGDLSDRIRIRLRVTSDGAWSDEDGLWPTQAGAVQVDDISLTTSQGSFSEDFEGPGPFYLFNPDKAAFAGDFAEAYPRLTDIDPCQDNTTPMLGMIDFNQVVRNGPAIDGVTVRTGGSTSPGISYGITGNYVSNYTGGLSFGQASVTNEIWSPDIAWDLPGTADDAIEISGSFLSFTAWTHLPLLNGYFLLWHVRSAAPGEPYGAWVDRNFVYYGGGVPAWLNLSFGTSDLIRSGPERVQVALAAWDYAAAFGFPGNAATPSPVFDNVRFAKFRVGGPAFAATAIQLAGSGFPPNGSIDVSTAQSRDALDVPFDTAGDVNTGNQFNVPGDSVLADVESVIPGADVTDIRMVWALKTNPVFEDALRSAPSRAKDENVTAGAAGTIWTGEVVADTATTSAGVVVSDRYFFDLPDLDFLYPGDDLHYYFQATDSDGRTTTFPSDTVDFLDFSTQTRYERYFTVHGLPSIHDTDGAQPAILLVDETPYTIATWTTAFRRPGLTEGVDFDVYSVLGAGSGVSNGIGSSGAHGATAGQLVGYENLFFNFGERNVGALSNGDPTLSGNDKSNDLDVLEQWHAAPGTRNMAYFGDNIASTMAAESPEALAYLTSIMGVDAVSPDVRPAIGGQTTPRVVPNVAGTWAPNFATEYIAYGGCLAVNQFDWISPLVGAEAGHLFTDASGVPIDDPGVGVASIVHPTTNGVQITFPHGCDMIYGDVQRAPVNLPAATRLFDEIFGLFNVAFGAPVLTGTTPARIVELDVSPNPFNPSTTVHFTAAFGARGSVRVYNLRGQLVRTLHEGEFLAQDFPWTGRDDAGASVASGIYLVRGEVDGKVLTKKVALVR